jgi:pimeloyl-CoA synthetase
MSVKDNVDSEQEYFHRLEVEKLGKIKAESDAVEAVEASEAARELHHHMCGKCGISMSSVLFKGVEIERCSGCGAVLLDPGELEQLAGEDESGFLAGLFGLV